MNIQHYKLNLDLLKSTATPILYGYQFDKKSRYIDVTLTANDAEVTLDSSMTAVLNAVTNNVIVASAQSCTISNNVIVVELTDNVLSLPGVTKCEIVLSDSSGAIITAQHFIVKVTEKAINDKSKFEPAGSSLITEAEVKAILKNYYSSSEVESLLDEYDELVAGRINSKADKQDLDNLSKTVSTKADKSSFEQGSGNLSCIDDVAKSVIKSVSFNYVKNNNAVTITFNIVFNAGTIPQSGFVRFSGLPFKTLNAQQLLSKVVDNKNKEYYCKLYGTWIAFTAIGGASVVADESLVFSAVYII